MKKPGKVPKLPWTILMFVPRIGVMPMIGTLFPSSIGAWIP
jgi:hypothetical protein